MEYLSERLIEQVCEEITGYSELLVGALQGGLGREPTRNPKLKEQNLLNSHALIKAQSKDYIRESQVRVILEPIASRLIETLGSTKDIEYKLNQILSKQRTKSSISVEYGPGNIINLCHLLKINLSSYDFSHLAIRQADLRHVNLHHVNFARTDLTKSVFAETLSGVLSVRFNLDGRTLITGDSNNEIRLWQVEDGKQLLTLKGHTSWVWSVGFSPDGLTLISGSDDQTVKLWDINTGQCLKTLEGHTKMVCSVSFSLNGQTLASCSEDQTVKLWDASTGQCLKTLQGHTNKIWSVSFSPNGQILAS
ncbi:MAG TPA: WD40 repeat domain-containing protein, partial [Candidatus Caenarcaniphilales bacterium]